MQSKNKLIGVDTNTESRKKMLALISQQLKEAERRNAADTPNSKNQNRQIIQ